MNRARFEQESEGRWQRLAKLTRLAQQQGRGRDLAELPALYRRACADLALAQHRGYGTQLCERLNELVLEGHHALYGAARRHGLRRLVEFAAHTFPATVRAQWRIVALAHACFYVSFAATIAVALHVPDAAYAVLDAETLTQFEDMHQDSQHQREAGAGFVGFAHYLWHNGSIGMRTFAGGLLGGIGTLFILLYNGIVLGAVFGHLNRLGISGINAFAIGHGAFELTGIVLAGAAGLRLGLALFRPGSHRRGEALRLAAQPAGVLMGGAVLLIAVAACIEALWSPSEVSDATKFAVGGGLWLTVIAYLGLAGRARRAA